MGDRTRVTYGVEWNAGAVVPGTVCGFEQITLCEQVAQAFRSTMGLFAHTEVFAWGNADAWASDFEHPEMTHQDPNDGENSLFWVDNVHLVYVAAHGAPEVSISLASDHADRGHNGVHIDPNNPQPCNGCRAHYVDMRLGVKRLRWLILDICDAVIDAGDSVMRVWSGPSDGDSQNFRRSLHLVCAFIGHAYPDIDTGRGAEFATNISLGHPVGGAWLDAAFARSGAHTNSPIAIAFGRDEADAVARRDHGRLADRDLGSVEANWLAWKWRA